MRSFLRTFAGCLSAAALIFFCSCERHHPDELPVEEHGKAEPAKGEHAAHSDKRNTDQAHISPAPTPAQFFPESTPH
jgi:hypothetical protein